MGEQCEKHRFQGVWEKFIAPLQRVRFKKSSGGREGGNKVRVKDKKEGSSKSKGENVDRRCCSVNPVEPYARRRDDRASRALRRRRPPTPVDEDVDSTSVDAKRVVATRTK